MIISESRSRLTGLALLAAILLAVEAGYQLGRSKAEPHSGSASQSGEIGGESLGQAITGSLETFATQTDFEDLSAACEEIAAHLDHLALEDLNAYLHGHVSAQHSRSGARSSWRAVVAEYLGEFDPEAALKQTKELRNPLVEQALITGAFRRWHATNPYLMLRQC